MDGIIIKSLSGEYDVYTTSNDIITCKPVGLFRLQKIYPKVGDKVLIEDNTIKKIYDRRNDLIRPIVSNVDKAIIVTSVKEPDLNLNLLDRLLVNIEYNNIKPILVFSKMDLLDKNDNYDNVFNYYKNLGYHVYLLPFEKDEIQKELDNSICVLVGQSGVGKSTFVNLLTNLNIKTDEISKALGRGKHTTRHTELIKVSNGWIADTPGFGSLDFEMDEVTLSQNFKDFFECKCKYNGCLHLNEPGCMVKENVNKGIILKSRYDNYLSFIDEIRKKPKRYLKGEKI